MAGLVLVAGIAAGAIYGSLMPNRNHSLGTEYFHIARSIVAGEGFANPFFDRTGPTAWMPPLLPALLAALLWAADGSRTVVTEAAVFLQVCVLMGTGFFLLVLVRETTTRIWPSTVAVGYLIALAADFYVSFQVTHDCWLVLLALNVLIAGGYWWAPLGSVKAAACWGMIGGWCALVSPVVGFAWGVWTLVHAVRPARHSRLAVALLFAALMLAPWTLRNYLVFGRLIPIKSNLAYELYQSQCLQPRGLLRPGIFRLHPGVPGSAERSDYERLGEIAYLDLKRQQFWGAVAADPGDFLCRLADRFVATTFWYESFGRGDELRQPWVVWCKRLVYPLPFLALLVLVYSGWRQPLSSVQWSVIILYVAYLAPYIVASFYDRYGMPLIGMKVLLVMWAADRLLRQTLRRAARAQPDAGSNEQNGPAAEDKRPGIEPRCGSCHIGGREAAEDC